MYSRKRQAPEPILPIRSPKQPRLAVKRYDGAAPSPSEREGILSRWTRFGQEFLDLLADTAVAVVPLPRRVSPASCNSISCITMMQNGAPLRDGSTYQPVSSDSSPIGSPPPAQASSPLPSSDDLIEDNAPTPKQNTTHIRTDTNLLTIREDPIPIPEEPTPQNSTSLFKSTPTRWSQLSESSNEQLSPEQVLKQDVLPRMKTLQLEGFSVQSSQASDSSILFSKGSQSSQTSSERSKTNPLRRNRRRQHIYSKVHKAHVRRDHRKLREEMWLELYELRRRQGFSSGLSDFKGLLEYQRRLEDFVDLEHPNPSIRPSTYLKSWSMKHPAVGIEPDENFLQRAIDNAKATLNSPKPPKPFSPTIELLEQFQRKKDEALERRIRPPAPPLPSSLPLDDEKQVAEILRRRGVVSKFAREQVSDQDLSRLRPGQWLNDEIINFYGAMILARSEGSKENPGAKTKAGQPKKTPLNAHYFSSFFWAKLTQEGYDKGRLAKWTKKIDIFSKDIILVPVNHGNAHWTAAAINFRQKRFESYDSMDMAKERVFKALRSYVNDEHNNKKKKPFDFTGWEDWAPPETPQQENGFDCGVFTCQFLEALSRGEEFFNFSQKDMPYLRRRMIWEIGNAKLRDGH